MPGAFQHGSERGPLGAPRGGSPGAHAADGGGLQLHGQKGGERRTWDTWCAIIHTHGRARGCCRGSRWGGVQGPSLSGVPLPGGKAAPCADDESLRQEGAHGLQVGHWAARALGPPAHALGPHPWVTPFGRRPAPDRRTGLFTPLPSSSRRSWPLRPMLCPSGTSGRGAWGWWGCLRESTVLPCTWCKGCRPCRLCIRRRCRATWRWRRRPPWCNQRGTGCRPALARWRCHLLSTSQWCTGNRAHRTCPRCRW